MNQRLNDVMPNWKTGGIFSYLQQFDVPWQDDLISTSLDLVYHGNTSGKKFVSPMVRALLDDETLTDADCTLLATAIYSLNAVTWSKAWEAINAEYSPLDNYNMIENMTDNETVYTYGKTETRTDNLSHSKTGTESTEHDTTDTTTKDLAYSEDGTDQRTVNLSDAETKNISHGKSGSDTVTYNTTDTRTDALSDAKTGTEQRTLNLSDAETKNLSHTKTGTEQTQTEPETTTYIDDAVYGFNSSQATPANTQEQRMTGQSSEVVEYDVTEADTGTDTTLHSGTDTTTYNVTNAQTGTVTDRKTGTDSTQYNTTETETGTDTTLHTGTDNSVKNATKTETGTDTTDYTGTDTLTFDTSESDTGTQETEQGGSDTQTNNYQLTRRGNIGVTTSQQMLESEMLLREKWNFFYQIVFPSIDKVLTLSAY